jgi:Spy/CpxP family protein refolding chaperone
MMMKNLIFCLALLFSAFGATAQTTTTGKTPAQEATEKMTLAYGLNDKQQSEMLKIQERKYRNLADIEPLKNTDPALYIRKVQAIQYGNNESFERLLNAEQAKVLKQQQFQLRNKKATAYKEMKAAGAPQQEIDKKMAALDLEAL